MEETGWGAREGTIWGWWERFVGRGGNGLRGKEGKISGDGEMGWRERVGGILVLTTLFVSTSLGRLVYLQGSKVFTCDIIQTVQRGGVIGPISLRV